MVSNENPSTVVSKLTARPPTPTSNSRQSPSCSSSTGAQQQQTSNQDDVFQIALRAEQLLKEILNKKTTSNEGSGSSSSFMGLLPAVKQEPQQPNEFPFIVTPSSVSPPPRPPLHSLNHHFTMQPQMMGQFVNMPPPPPIYNHQGIPAVTPAVSDPNFYARNPPPGLFMPQVVPSSMPPSPAMVSLDMLRPPSNRFPYHNSTRHHHPNQHQQQPQPVQIVNTVVVGSGGQLYALANPTVSMPPPMPSSATIAAPPSLYPRFSAPNGYNRGYNKRKYGDMNGHYGKRFNKGYNDRFGRKEENGSKKKKKVKNDEDSDESDDESNDDSNDESDEDDEEEDDEDESIGGGVSDDDDDEEENTHQGHDEGLEPGESDDPNVARERELNELKSRSVVDKMAIFLDYYQQFRVAYMQRVQQIDQCPDSLRLQFNALSKFMHEYESVLSELNQIVLEHEREHVCKNNHRKTKKLFNKSKAFIRYDCTKRLQSNIFEYRRFTSSQDRYAGMYDLIDMNNYLISLLPDIGVSVRRYINKCERLKQEELNEHENEEEESLFLSDIMNSESQDSTGEGKTKRGDDTSGGPSTSGSSTRHYESFSIGIDTLNRRLLERVDKEESLDELVKERIVKWINKRQSKYILIFSEMDKLLNQHKDGECHVKFHSFLQFNLGKLITVCDSYHQKLKELLYSTTIKRKKKRKKVKLLPEVMQDVFGEIDDLKRTLEHTKMLIKRCHELKNKSNAAAVAAAAAAAAAATTATSSASDL